MLTKHAKYNTNEGRHFTSIEFSKPCFIVWSSKVFGTEGETASLTKNKHVLLSISMYLILFLAKLSLHRKANCPRNKLNNNNGLLGRTVFKLRIKQTKCCFNQLLKNRLEY